MLIVVVRLYHFFVAVILLAFFLSAYVLESLGVQYVSEGGGYLFKVHIYSYLIIGAFLFVFFRRGLGCFFSGISSYKYYWWISVFGISIVIAYGLMRFGFSGMAYLVDALLVPVILMPLVALLGRADKRRLLALLGWLIFLNSILSLTEFAMQARFFSGVILDGFTHFRSTALLSHPLNNALITASLAPLLMRSTSIPVSIYFIVILLALFAFGGRGAMAVYLTSTAILLAVNLRFSGGMGINKRLFVFYYFVFLVCTILLIYVIAVTSVADRVISKLYVDESAQVRVDAFTLLWQLSPAEWLRGANYFFLDNIDAYIGTKIVENYLIGWVLSFGAVGALVLFFSIFSVPIKIAFRGGLDIKLAVFSFVLLSLTNNALSVKTQAVLLLVFAVFCFPDERAKHQAC